MGQFFSVGTSTYLKFQSMIICICLSSTTPSGYFASCLIWEDPAAIACSLNSSTPTSKSYPMVLPNFFAIHCEGLFLTFIPSSCCCPGTTRSVKTSLSFFSLLLLAALLYAVIISADTVSFGLLSFPLTFFLTCIKGPPDEVLQVIKCPLASLSCQSWPPISLLMGKMLPEKPKK